MGVPTLAGEYLPWTGEVPRSTLDSRVPTLDGDTYLGSGVPTMDGVTYLAWGYLPCMGYLPWIRGTYLCWEGGLPTPDKEYLPWTGWYLPWMGRYPPSPASACYRLFKKSTKIGIKVL